jgi:quinoprotein glucose dehydrogenase
VATATVPTSQKIIIAGKGMMPSFSHLSETEKQTIIDFLLNKIPPCKTITTDKPTPFFQHMGYNHWYDRAAYQVSKPPWGTLTAINLNTGVHLWQVPLGKYKELPAQGNYGGPLATTSGLIFIAAIRDEQIRAFDKKTGKTLWQHSFPAAGYVSASTYTANGKQYIVIAFGGGKLNTKSGDKYVAFAL